MNIYQIVSNENNKPYIFKICLIIHIMMFKIIAIPYNSIFIINYKSFSNILQPTSKESEQEYIKNKM